MLKLIKKSKKKKIWLTYLEEYYDSKKSITFININTHNNFKKLLFTRMPDLFAYRTYS